MPDYGRERIVLVEIDQPLCTRLYGDAFASPSGGCQAVLGTSGARKCFNTRFTCQDPDNYDPGTLTLRFGKRSHELARHYGHVIPSFLRHDTTPGALNLAGMYASGLPLGQREVVTLYFEDHRHSDLLVDKYRLERQTGAATAGSPTVTYDPYTRGTFWGKWLARNPYHGGYPLRVYEGYLGDALADMRVRHYIIDRIEGPAEGEVRIVAKDVFSKLEEKKAVAPRASRGELGSNISDVSSSATLSPSGIGEEDYPHRAGSPSEMYLAIGDELVKATRTNDALSLTQRGAFNTAADEHNDEDLVQWVLVYFAQRAHVIVYDLLVTWGGIDPATIDLDDWEEQAEQITQLYTGVIGKPTPIAQLIGELCEQAGFTVWHDPATGMINLRALRPSSSVATITDNGWIIDGTLATKRQDDKRVSQAWVYYGQKNPLEDQKDPRNYFSRVVVIDPDAESDEQYGTPKVREVFSRWIPQFGRDSAVETGERILSIFRNPPIEARFTVDAGRDDDLLLARFYNIQTAEVQDETGAVDTARQYAVVSLERSEARVEVVAQGMAFASIPGTAPENDPITIFIENDTFNLNLRSVFDSLYETPEEGSPSRSVTFVVLEGVKVGSSSTGSPAMRTGSWPGSVDLYLTNHGRIQGKGGAGGKGGGVNDQLPGHPGGNGGDALLVETLLSIDNADGEIWGGGGGGGGGGGKFFLGEDIPAGSGGGGGAGTGAGDGGQPGTPASTSGNPGQNGTDAAGGAGGAAVPDGGAGGNGGGPGLAGSAGNAATGNGANPGGSGGQTGRYVTGNSFVNWIAVGDRRGSAV